MTLKEAIETIRQVDVKPYLLPGNKSGYLCPHCGSGTHVNGTGAVQYYPATGTASCFSCKKRVDAIDMYKLSHNVDFKQAIESLAEENGIQLQIQPGYSLEEAIADFSNPGDAAAIQPRPTPLQASPSAQAITPRPQNISVEAVDADVKEADFTEEVKRAHEELLATPIALQYLQEKRGLSLDIIKAYSLGFDAKGCNNVLKYYPDLQSQSRKAWLYQYILPYPWADGRYHYFLSEIIDRNETDDCNGKYKKIRHKKEQIFNERYLQNPPPVIFLCEGIYDALSVEQVGGKAISFVGLAPGRFFDLCAKYKPNTFFIISLDNDSSGTKATERVKNGLDKLNLPYIVRTAPFGKDFNEALQTDRGAFMEYIQQIVSDAEYITRNEQHEATLPLSAEDAAPSPMDYSKYYDNCRQALRESSEAQQYLASRGISMETAIAAGLGYDPASDPANAPAAPAEAFKECPCPRIIVPVSSSCYEGYSTQGDADGQYNKLYSSGSTVSPLFPEYLQQSDNVFIVGDCFDALALREVEAPVVAATTATSARALVEKLKIMQTPPTLLLAYGKSDADKKAQTELQRRLNELNISNAPVDICGRCDSASEHLAKDRISFKSAVSRAIAAQGIRPDNIAGYLDDSLMKDISDFQKFSKRKTGFPNLDRKIGALYPGLYVLAAISSLGKTTFALQMADQLAEQGEEVLFFSMEQSRFEIAAKSLARQIAMQDISKDITSLDIRKGKYAETPEVLEKYKATVGDRLSVIELNFNGTIGYIRQYIENHIKRTGTSPTVFVDYLQILQPQQDGKSGRSKKDEIDLCIIQLKRISRDYSVPVIVISSLNRVNYQAKFSFESLKESGTIEYSADVVWGLQLQCISDPQYKSKGQEEKREAIQKAKKEAPRKIKLTCEKNRYGISHFACCFDYYSRYDLFIHTADPKDD